MFPQLSLSRFGCGFNGFEECNGAQIGVSGDLLPKEESAIVIANHVG
jgi:hypothetical protein